jgi:hypothetical protein
VASLLPWAIDWFLLASLWAGLPFVATATVVAVYLDLTRTSADLLQRDGLRATAVVMEVKKPLMNVVVNNIYVKRTLRLRIERDDHAPPYLASYTGLFTLGEVPERGAALQVVVDPKRPQRVAAAEVTAQPGSPSRTTWKFTSWHGPASSTPNRPKPPKPPKTPKRPEAADPAKPAYAPYQPSPAGGEGRDLTGELRELADLHERGQLTDDEFTLAKRRLLSGAEDSAPPE